MTPRLTPVDSRRWPPVATCLPVATERWPLVSVLSGGTGPRARARVMGCLVAGTWAAPIPTGHARMRERDGVAIAKSGGTPVDSVTSSGRYEGRGEALTNSRAKTRARLGVATVRLYSRPMLSGFWAGLGFAFDEEASPPRRVPKRERPRCGARCRTGAPCRAPAVWDAESNEPRNGRCRMHGGLSTGARTEEGRARLREAGRRGALARWAKRRVELGEVRGPRC